MVKCLKGALSVLSAAAVLAAVPAGASAQLVSTGTITLGGTGIGSQATTLTVQSPGNTTTESGCSTPTGTSCAGFADVGVKTGASQTGTIFLSSLAGINGSNLGIVLNFAEPQTVAEQGATLNGLVLNLYGNTGSTPLFSALLAPVPVVYANTQAGTGNSGYLFTLSSSSAAAFNAAVLAGGTQIGVGASLSDVTGGNETIFVAKLNTSVTATPEPASLVLLGTGLVGVFGAGYRRRKNNAA